MFLLFEFLIFDSKSLSSIQKCSFFSRKLQNCQVQLKFRKNGSLVLRRAKDNYDNMVQKISFHCLYTPFHTTWNFKSFGAWGSSKQKILTTIFKNTKRVFVNSRLKSRWQYERGKSAMKSTKNFTSETHQFEAWYERIKSLNKTTYFPNSSFWNERIIVMIVIQYLLWSLLINDIFWKNDGRAFQSEKV